MIIKWDLAFFYLKAGQILALFNENKKPLIKRGSTMAARKIGNVELINQAEAVRP